MTRAQLLAILTPLVRQLVRGGFAVESFAALGDDVTPYAGLTLATPAGLNLPVTVRGFVANQQSQARLALLQTAIITALRPWQTATRNGFDVEGSVIRGLPGQELVYGQQTPASSG